MCKRQTQRSVADPGFSKVGRLPIILQNFCRKLHENERIWTEEGERAFLAPLLDPQLQVV